MKESVVYVVHPYMKGVLRARCRFCRFFCNIGSREYRSVEGDGFRFPDFFAQCLTRVDIHGEQRVDHWTSANAFCCERFAPKGLFKVYTASEQLNLFNTQNNA